jgi:hypothetical protein
MGRTRPPMSEREDYAMQVAWQVYRLKRPGFHLAYYVAGRGPIVLSLSGGSGDDQQYLCPVANPTFGLLGERSGVLSLVKEGCHHSRGKRIPSCQKDRRRP